eukprot:800305-Prorocentrum_minimum.AAC.1
MGEQKTVVDGSLHPPGRENAPPQGPSMADHKGPRDEPVRAPQRVRPLSASRQERTASARAKREALSDERATLAAANAANTNTTIAYLAEQRRGNSDARQAQRTAAVKTMVVESTINRGAAPSDALVRQRESAAQTAAVASNVTPRPTYTVPLASTPLSSPPPVVAAASAAAASSSAASSSVAAPPARSADSASSSSAASSQRRASLQASVPSPSADNLPSPSADNLPSPSADNVNGTAGSEAPPPQRRPYTPTPRGQALRPTTQTRPMSADARRREHQRPPPMIAALGGPSAYA